MILEQIKDILVRWRPGLDEESDPETAAALLAAQRDPLLAPWLARQEAFHREVRHHLRSIEPPLDLRARILAGPAPRPVPVWWRRPGWLAAAAAFLLMSVLGIWWLRPQPANQWAAYRTRMARVVLREYRMDLMTADAAQIRQFLAARGAPADYALPAGCRNLPHVGGASLRWQNRPVSMICLRRDPNDMVWLFVADESATADPPPRAVPRLVAVGKLMTASWTQQGRSYLLAIVGDDTRIQRYL